MEYPMRIYGMNIYETYLSLWLKLISIGGMLFSLSTIFYFDSLFPTGKILGGISITVLFMSCVMMGLASAGIRQNRSVLDPAMSYFFISGVLFPCIGIYHRAVHCLIVGVVILAFIIILFFLKRQAIRTRFKPRFFSQRQFETMIKIADAMIDGDGKEAIGPIEVAVNTDHLLDGVSLATSKQFKLVMVIVEWILPLIKFSPYSFSNLGTVERRSLIEKVISSKGIFRNVSRALKLLVCAGYYGDPRGMKQVGYIPFDDRNMKPDKKPSIYENPFI